ncbi:MAG: hypothetical protein CR975_01380 [Gammaproteobacteria bacterium]|nr:MAG: hypothetical protein CR975_01380 [Gammaproteobacteria bacterium]
MKIIKKQVGFALLEVLVAALVLTVGGVAYMRLQQTGLQYSYNNYARTQGVAIIGDFIDTLRSNIDKISIADIDGSIISGQVGTDAARTLDISKIGDVFAFQQELVRQQLLTTVSNSVLCFRVRKDGLVRATYIWKDNSRAGKDVDLTTLSSGGYCPANFSAAIDAAIKQNTVTIYAQL